MAGHSPLHEPGTDEAGHVYPLDFTLAQARRVLAEQQAANIHDDKAMLRAAVHLEIALRDLLAALDAEQSE